ncbi:hypothetical protein HMPREF9074_07321, partial [Capnocytophaga sp. oral taxon 329 str. F0087]
MHCRYFLFSFAPVNKIIVIAMRQKLTYVLLWVLSAVGLSYAQELTITGVVK